MTLFPNLNFRFKLLGLVITVSGMAIVLAIGATSTQNYISKRQTAIQSVQTHAEVLASNCAAAVVFNDPDAAGEMLAAMVAVPGITAACIIDMDNEPFATYGDRDSDRSDIDPSHMSTSTHSGELVVVHGVYLEQERVGTIVLRYDMQSVHHQLILDLGMSALCATAALLVALVIAIGLQRTLTRPVVELERIVRDVSQSRNYKARAHKYSNDELGSLTDSFNDMLSQVQARDTALANARDRLEEQVAERTAELEFAKGQAEHAAVSLAKSEARIRTILKKAPDGIITFDAQGCISLTNPAAEAIFGLKQSHLTNLNINDLLDQPYSIDKTGIIHKAMPEGNQTSLGRFAELAACHAEHGSIPIQIAVSQTDMVGGGEFTAIIRDISDRVRSEQEKEQLNRRLVEESRRSGMAEIATGVLHNVGNVLTSVNVSVNMLNDRIGQSKLPSLIKAAELIDAHNDDLPTFIGQDEHGKHLPGFIVKIADYLNNEQAQITEELKTLVDQTQHVQEIISTQQSYAGTGGIVEVVDLNDIVQDALRINEAGLERHRVKLQFEYDDLSDMIVDKHKVLQILVNLISNAKYAADHSKPESWVRVHISTIQDPHQQVQIIVSDNGIGIDEDNLVRIFNHGFTTREDGHGFGLHNAALAARELAGSLKAESDGPGQGASFTFTFPVRSPQRQEAHHDSTS